MSAWKPPLVPRSRMTALNRIAVDTPPSAGPCIYPRHREAMLDWCYIPRPGRPWESAHEHCGVCTPDPHRWHAERSQPARVPAGPPQEAPRNAKH